MRSSSIPDLNICWGRTSRATDAAAAMQFGCNGVTVTPGLMCYERDGGPSCSHAWWAKRREADDSFLLAGTVRLSSFRRAARFTVYIIVRHLPTRERETFRCRRRCTRP